MLNLIRYLKDIKWMKELKQQNEKLEQKHDNFNPY